LLDETALAFFLYLRDLIQTTLGMSLKMIKQRTLEWEVTGLVRPPVSDTYALRSGSRL
jgi:hypothetical protein